MNDENNGSPAEEPEAVETQPAPDAELATGASNPEDEAAAAEAEAAVAAEEPAAEAAATAPLNDEDAAAAQAAEAELAMKAAAQAAVAEADTASEPIDPAKPDSDELDARVAGADVVNAEAAGEHDGATDSFTAMTTAGEQVQIVKKMAVGTLTILITDQDQRYIAPADGGMDLEAYDPKKHGGGEEAA